ncbi:hypothetical protein GCM10011369_36660 [Neiella marina]|uniref:HTH LytTR-type domain-containing protein n=1 Tax=Neiella marina TaxID=508461 RepID=A0A8J2UB87_9GAMM|nr:hypothetical protein GCM10011369_36660 [Neiella marina]
MLFNLYCVFWREYAAGAQYNFADSLIWFGKEWGGWLVATVPLILALNASRQAGYLLLGVAINGCFVVIFVMAVRIMLDTGEFGQASYIRIIIEQMPKHASALAIFVAIWFYLGGQRPSQSIASEYQPSMTTDEPCEALFIVAENQGIERQVAIADIIRIQAAKNYIDIETNDAHYVKRATLKHIADNFAASDLQQVHRSFIVNLAKVAQLRKNSNGGTLVVMEDGSAVPVSKSYAARLKQRLM